MALEWELVGNLKGPKGDQGDPGPKGDQGDPGPTGASGGVSSVNTRTGDVTGLAEASDVSTALAAKADTSALTAHTSNTSNPHSVTATQVGLGNVDNTSDANKPVSTAQQSAIDTAVANLVNSAPGTLDTLGEIATQLASDESAAAALTTTVGGKLTKTSNLSDIASVSAARSNLGLATVASSGSYADLTGTPSLATVATSGSYTDLTSKPAIPAAPTAVDATIVVGGTSTAPTVKVGTVSEASLVLASDAVATTPSRRTLGTGSQQAAAGNHTHSQYAPIDSPTFTTSVTLPGSPTSALQAAPKQYVDAAVLPPLPSGYYVYTTSHGNGATTSATLGINTLRVAPWQVTRTTVLTQLVIDVSTAGESGSQFRPVIYADSGSTTPGALVVDGGAISTGTAAMVQAAVSVTLSPGLYWIGGMVQTVTTTQPTMRTITTNWTPPISLPIGTTLPSQAGSGIALSVAGGAGAAPSTFPAGWASTITCARLLVKVG